MGQQEPIEIFEYHNQHTYEEVIRPSNPRHATIYLRADHTKNIYNRSVGSMLEFLGDIGGLIEIVFLTVASCIVFITERNFKAAMISDTYKVQKYSRD